MLYLYNTNIMSTKKKLVNIVNGKNTKDGKIEEKEENIEDDDDEEESDEENEEDEEEDEEDDYKYEIDDIEDEDVEDDEDDEDDDPIDCLYDQEIQINEHELDLETEIPTNERMTLNIMTKYEISRILGIRVQQLIKGAKPLVSNTNGKSSIEIAIDELMSGSMPFKIKRPLPSGEYEIWKCKELTVFLTQDDIIDIISALDK
jgi:DNA-directed RNA polymerase subunit K/omega